MGKTVLEVKDLTKVFPGGWLWKRGRPQRKPATVAVDSISFKINEGEIVGLLGPNGAGKTTTIQMLLGTTSKTKGEIKYFGKEFEKHRPEILKEVNYASAYIGLPQYMTIWENLMVYARMYEVSNPRERVKLVLEFFRMSEYANKAFNTLSSGQITRVILAKAMINFPKLLLLDEPTASLDPEIAEKVRQFLLKQQEKYQVAMLFTSHNMAEITEVCDRVIFLRKGRIVAEDTPKGLAQRIKICTVRLKLGEGRKRFQVFSAGRHYDYELKGNEAVIRIEEDKVVEFLDLLARQAIKYHGISIDKPTLEDFFLEQAYE